ncbi:YcaO-like family protein [Actinoplanes sp. NPDC051411]|uniref:YcaO-like family protein n=1 Tax=Actinoplanes sp. NPDC051411 TaxID=3155522 RepID=UPI0034129AF6
MLIDELFGVVRRVTPLRAAPGDPDGLVGYSASVGDLGRVSRWMPDVVGSGLTFDAEKSRAAAIGEAVERYCGNVVTTVHRRADLRTLRAERAVFLDPAAAPLFTAEQYARPAFPLRPITEDVVVPWVRGTELTAGNRPALMPAPLTYLNYYRGSGDPTGAERRFPVLLPGIAAGPSLAFAIRSALLEVIERDATALWWLGREPAREIVFPAGHPVPEQALAGCHPGTRLWWLLLPSDFDVPTIACALTDDETTVLAVGFATRPDPVEAALKAAAEAFQLRRLASACLDPQSWLWRGAADGLLHFPLRPYRADRAYADDFADDFSDMRQLMHNVQYFLDPRTQPYALDRLRPVDSIGLDELPPFPGGLTDADLVARFAARGMAAYAADLTTDDVRRHGYHVARVIAPDAIPNMPTALPTLGNRRLRRRTAGRAPDVRFDLSPMPHA